MTLTFDAHTNLTTWKDTVMSLTTTGDTIKAAFMKVLFKAKAQNVVFSFSLGLTSSAGGQRANSSGCLLLCRASWLRRSSSSWLLKANSPSTLWSGVKYRKLKSEEVSVRPESSLSPARVGDLTWGKVRKKRDMGWGVRRMKTCEWVGMGGGGCNERKLWEYWGRITRHIH